MQIGSEHPYYSAGTPAVPATGAAAKATGFEDLVRGENSPGTGGNPQESEASREAADAVAYVREHGLVAYAEELRRQKIEEMREEILRTMGLTEEALSALPAEQRSAIEKAIAQEIEKRLAAETLGNGGSGDDGRNGGRAAGLDGGASNLMLAQAAGGDAGAVAGLAIMDAVASGDPAETHRDR